MKASPILPAHRASISRLSLPTVGGALLGLTLWLGIIVLTILLVSAVTTARAAITEFPPEFSTRKITSPAGAEIFVRHGGHGPAVVMLHGFGDTGDMWAPLAAELMKDHTVIVPDLRGFGKSSLPDNGYEKMTQAKDIRAVVTALGFDRAAVVAHDIGNMVAYAYSVTYRDKVDRLVVMDAPIPGLPGWQEQLLNPKVWHFNFFGPDVERLLAGRERIYLDRFYNEFSADPAHVDEATRSHYAALYAQPGAMHAALMQFHAFSQDARDNEIPSRTKLTMPLLAIGGEKSYGVLMPHLLTPAAADVRGAVVPNAGHWIMEENPTYATALISAFLRERETTTADLRLTPAEFRFSGSGPGGTGTSGVDGVQTTILKGNPNDSGPYTILLRVPPHTRITPHEHPDDRIAVVISGTWHFGYGEKFAAEQLRTLPPGSVYTEPPHRPHYAETGDEAVVVAISGYGPSGTTNEDAVADPRK
jgi:pimeloyl-ACP methyl ester carboxylesterase